MSACSFKGNVSKRPTNLFLVFLDALELHHGVICTVYRRALLIDVGEDSLYHASRAGVCCPDHH